MLRRVTIACTVLGLASGLAGCGGGGGAPPMVTPQPPPEMPVKLAVTGMAVVKVQGGGNGVAVLEERLSPLAQPGPDRTLALLDGAGATTGQYSPPAGFALIDFTQHPSGEVSMTLATAKTVRIVRIDRLATVVSDFALADPQAPNDPFYDHGGIRDDTSLLPFATRDAVRIAAIGESVAVALRTGRNAVVAYRLDYAPPGGYARIWRTLVEPGLSMFLVGITSGTFDTFGQLENHWHVLLDADAEGDVAVGVVGKPGSAEVFGPHADFFGEPTNVVAGMLVTRLAPDGRRIGATVIDTVQSSEAHGLRMNGDDIAIVGRVFTERRDDGSGWNAFAAHVSRSSGELHSYRVLDVDRGDVLFDIVPLARGLFLAGGTTGYTQNPTGASISEQAAPLLVVLGSDGTLRQRIDVPAGPRQNQVRSIAPRGANWLLGGMVDGPGTHSGDEDPTLIVANGFAREMAIAP